MYDKKDTSTLHNGVCRRQSSKPYHRITRLASLGICVSRNGTMYSDQKKKTPSHFRNLTPNPALAPEGKKH